MDIHDSILTKFQIGKIPKNSRGIIRAIDYEEKYASIHFSSHHVYLTLYFNEFKIIEKIKKPDYMNF